MDIILANSLEQIVSAPRLQRYRNVAGTDLETVLLYCWNIQLAEALIPPLAILEVALRNAVHDALTTHTGTDFWFKSILHPKKYGNVTDLMARITTRQGYPPSAGKVISEITFGFWPAVFARRYNALWWGQPYPMLSSVIPNHPNVARDTRAKFEQRLEYFVSLRNRLMHQEAVFQGVAAVNRPIMPIETLHAQLLETIGWINHDAATLAICMDRFDAIHDVTGRAALERTIKTAFNIP